MIRTIKGCEAKLKLKFGRYENSLFERDGNVIG
jgi:hypothetical protein